MPEENLRAAALSARKLALERLAEKRDLTSAETADLIAIQGCVLRETVLHCTHAIVNAIRERDGG